MKMNPYLTFNGTCEEAFKTYQKILGGKIEAMMPFEGTPSEAYVPAEWRKKIMHACLVFGDNKLMASDGQPDRSETMQGISVALHPTEPAEADRLFNALSENGKVIMPLEETFWAQKFGMLVDRFGTPWMINCSRPM
ncbi:MAG: VOC family protein [Methyloceanibacter sp.]